VGKIEITWRKRENFAHGRCVMRGPFVYTARTTWTVKLRKEKFFNNLFLSSLENLIC